MIAGTLEQRSIAAAQAGDRSAFRELYEANARVVFGYVRARVAHHEAEDLTAEVFCTAWRKLPDYEWRGTPFRAWLLTIAKNLMRAEIRRKAVVSIQPTPSGELEFEGAERPDVMALAELSTVVIMDALELLKLESRSVLTLRFLEELTVSESAKRIGCSNENVRVRTFRALKELRTLTIGELDER